MNQILPHEQWNRWRAGSRRAPIGLVAALVLLASFFAQAQETRTPATMETTVKGATPRSAMLAYLEAARAGGYTRAAEYLDLRTIPPPERRSQGPLLAREPKIVLDRKLWMEIDPLSDAPEGEADDGLPLRRQRRHRPEGRPALDPHTHPRPHGGDHSQRIVLRHAAGELRQAG